MSCSRLHRVATLAWLRCSVGISGAWRCSGLQPGCSSPPGTLAAELFYDPMGRLYETRNYSCGSVSDARNYVYDGDALVEEYDLSGNVIVRHIHGPAAGVKPVLNVFQ
ncbi:MAG: hypothetical protein ABJP48_00010 [Erythrobacter sp.]